LEVGIFSVPSTMESASLVGGGAPVANFALIRAIATAMLGSISYGVDVQIAGALASYDSFLEEWCVPNFGGVEHCQKDSDALLHNSSFQDVFMVLTAYLITCGMAVGAIMAGPYLCNKFGRRTCVSFGGFLTFVGAVITSFLCFGNVTMFYISRFITGFGVGAACFAVPIYNSEISTPAWRGTTGALYQISVNIGQMIASTALATITDWRIGTFLPGITGLVVALSVWTIPESPRYIMQTRGMQEALVILRKVRGGDVTEEARVMEQKLNEEKDQPSVTYAQLWTNLSLRRRTFVAVWLQIGQQLTAINVYLGLWTTVAGHLNIKNPNGFTATWITPIMLVGTIISVALIDTKFGGRKTLLLVACLVMLPAQIVTGISPFAGWSGGVNGAAVSVYSFGFALAWGTVAWVLPSELFSMAEKGPAIGLATFFQFAMNLVVGAPSAVLLRWNAGGFFFILEALQVTNIAYVLIFVKETRGIPLEEVPDLFKTK